MRFALSVAMAIFCCLVSAALSGCNQDPSDSENKQAEVVVAHTPPQVLNSDGINEIVRLAKARDLARYEPRVFQVTGNVVKTVFTADSSKDDGHGDLQLILSYPSYEAVEFTCYFSTENEQKIRKIEVGRTVTVTGKFKSAYGTSIALKGCKILD